MNWTQITVSSLVTLAAVVTIAVGGLAYAWSTYGGDALAAGWRYHGMSDAERHHTWCAQEGASFDIALITPFVDAELDLTEDQRANWDTLVQRLSAASESVREPVCALDAGGALTEQVRGLKAALDAGASVLADLEPEIGLFYTSLDAEQRAQLDTAFSERRSRRHGGWR